MQERTRALRTYTCRFTSFSRGPEKTDQATFSYYFKKPNWVRMEALSGKNEGSILLYSGKDVRVKPGHGILSWFSYSFAPTHKYVCDARGNGVLQSSWGYYINEHLEMKHLTRSAFQSVETLDGRKALHFLLTSDDPQKTKSIAREDLWIDAREFLLIQYKQYDTTGTMIQSGFYQDCVIDSELNDRLFTEFSK